jgi:peptidoglycan/LPS O-acetylase OafA/YrhL
MSTINYNNKTNPLYILRFIAAALVVFYHYEPHVLKDSIFHELISKSSEFVNFFYFISGFVLVIAYQKSLSLKVFPRIEFWVKRLARIYPAYLFALILTLAFHFFVKSTFTSIQYRLPLEVLMLQNWVYNASMNYPSWSVSCELFFYFVFPFAIPKLIRYYLKLNLFKIFALFYIFIFVFVFISYYLKMQNTDTTNLLFVVIKNHPIPRLAIFILGTYCGFLFNSEKIEFINNSFNSRLISIISLLLIVFFLHTSPKNSIIFDFGALAPIYFFFVLSICNAGEKINSFLSNKYFMYAGEISYGVYILQYPVNLYYNHFIMSTLSIQGFFIYLFLLIIVSALCYKYIESPMRNKISKWILN